MDDTVGIRVLPFKIFRGTELLSVSDRDRLLQVFACSQRWHHATGRIVVCNRSLDR